MSQEKLHDLHHFIRRLSDRMADHYKQIQEHAAEDPGTAGDQGEENWLTYCADGFRVPTRSLRKGKSLAKMDRWVHKLMC